MKSQFTPPWPGEKCHCGEYIHSVDTTGFARDMDGNLLPGNASTARWSARCYAGHETRGWFTHAEHEEDLKHDVLS